MRANVTPIGRIGLFWSNSLNATLAIYDLAVTHFAASTVESSFLRGMASQADKMKQDNKIKKAELAIDHFVVRKPGTGWNGTAAEAVTLLGEVSDSAMDALYRRVHLGNLNVSFFCEFYSRDCDYSCGCGSV